MKEAPGRTAATITAPLLFTALLAAGGCSGISERPAAADGGDGPPRAEARASAEELRLYVDEARPEPVATIRFQEPLRWTALNPFFVIVETRNGPHLVEMAWECGDLVSDQIYADMADRRSKRGILRARIDTLRGCRIANFYKLAEENAVEIDDINGND